MSNYSIVSIPNLAPGMPWERGQREDDRLAAWQRYSMWHPGLPMVTVHQNPGGNVGGLNPARIQVSRTGINKGWAGPVWHVLSTAVLLFTLSPLIALAAEPCKVNVRTCSAQQCAYLPGIGPSKGAAIEAAHPTDEAALDSVPGIGDATLAKIRPFVTFQGETTCTSKQAAPKP